MCQFTCLNSCRQVHMFVDSREKVTARYQVGSRSRQTIFAHCLITAHEFHKYNIIMYFGFVFGFVVELSIKEGSDGVWKLKADGHSFTKSSQRMGMADSSFIWWTRWSSPKWGLESCCSCATCIVCSLSLSLFVFFFFSKLFICKFIAQLGKDHAWKLLSLLIFRLVITM